MAAPRLTSLIRVPRWGLWFMRYSFSQSASSSITGTFPRRRPIPYGPETLPSSPLWGRPQPKGLHPPNSNTHPLYLQGQNQIAANLLDWNCSTSSAEKNPFHTPGRHLMSCQGPTLPGDWLATSFPHLCGAVLLQRARSPHADLGVSWLRPPRGRGSGCFHV